MIIAVKYYPTNDETNEKLGVTNVELKDTNQSEGKKESVASFLMGSTSNQTSCGSCAKTKVECMGHTGYMELPKHIYMPLYLQYIINYLKIICVNCSNIIIKQNNNQLKNLRSTIVSKIKKGLKCEHCGAPAYAYTLDPVKKGNIIMERHDYVPETKKSTIGMSRHIFADEVYKIFSCISKETYEKLKVYDYKHLSPVNFLSKKFIVPSNKIRPNPPYNRSKNSKNDYNTKLNSILQAASKVSAINESSGSDEDYVKFQCEIYSFHKNLPISSKKTANLSEPLKSKKGYIRQIVLGQRTNSVNRQFITGNNFIKIDEIVIPRAMADNICIISKVHKGNFELMKIIVSNGQTKRPRCLQVEKKNGYTYSTNVIKIDIEIGDIVYHDFIDGYYVNTCRQPSLMKSNMTAMKGKISDTAPTLQLNSNSLAFFAGDFDGDEMNLYHDTDEISCYESSKMAGAHEMFISDGYGSPLIGQIQDGLIGLSFLTKDNTYISIKNAYRLFDDLDLEPEFIKDIIQGREILTELFRLLKISINYEGYASFYKENYKSFRSYSETEIKVIIKDGCFISGVIDKSTVGSKSYNALYHRVAAKHGRYTSMQLVWYMQQIAIKFINMRGYTFSVSDIIISKEVQDEIIKFEEQIYAESVKLTEDLHSGKIFPPPGFTTESYYEKEQIKILSNINIAMREIHLGTDYENNNFYAGVMHGSKGSIANLTEGICCIGQQNKGANRQPLDISGRSNIFYPKNSPDPCARGYVKDSYASNLGIVSLVNLAPGQRQGLIDKALSTAKSGEKYRQSVSSLESNIVNNWRHVVKGPKLRQTLYGGDGMDPRMTIKVKFPDLEKIKEPKVKKFFELYEFNYRARLDSKPEIIIPVNVDLIMKDIKCTGKKPLDIKIIKSYVDKIPRYYLNSNYTGPVPEFYKKSSKIFRNYLIYKIMEEMPTEEELNKIFEFIRIYFMNNLHNVGMCVGLAASQAISEPNTQIMLDSIHGSNKSKIQNLLNYLDMIPTDKIKNLGMEIYITNDNPDEIIHQIEMIKLIDFADRCDIFYEKYGESVYDPKENKNTKEFATNVPKDLANWCIRIQLNRKNLITKKMLVETIYINLSKRLPWTFIVYENLIDEPYLRIYLRQEVLNNIALNSSTKIKPLAISILDTNIRGIDGIYSAKWNGKFIETDGSNLGEVILLDNIDISKTRSNSVLEMYKYYGITAIRTLLIDYIQNCVPKAYISHYTIYVDEMCALDYPTAINRYGSAKRNSSIGQLITDASYEKFMLGASTTGKLDYLTGPNGCILEGVPAKVGSNYARLIINEEFIKNQRKEVVSELEEI